MAFRPVDWPGNTGLPVTREVLRVIRESPESQATPYEARCHTRSLATALIDALDRIAALEVRLAEFGKPKPAKVAKPKPEPRAPRPPTGLDPFLGGPPREVVLLEPPPRLEVEEQLPPMEGDNNNADVVAAVRTALDREMWRPVGDIRFMLEVYPQGRIQRALEALRESGDAESRLVATGGRERLEWRMRVVVPAPSSEAVTP